MGEMQRLLSSAARRRYLECFERRNADPSGDQAGELQAAFAGMLRLGAESDPRDKGGTGCPRRANGGNRRAEPGIYSTRKFVTRDDWPLQRRTILTNDRQQLFAQAREASVAGCANEISARVLNKAMQARQQLFPIPQGPAAFHPFGSTHLKDIAHGAMQALLQNVGRELCRCGTLRTGGAVGAPTREIMNS